MYKDIKMELFILGGCDMLSKFHNERVIQSTIRTLLTNK